VSRIYAAVEAVDGVASLTLRGLSRFGEPERGELAAGYLPIGRFEIAQLDNDPSFPEHGSIELEMRGGK
jgi:hypothetical protein